MPKTSEFDKKIILYSNALERKNFQLIESRIDEELEQIADTGLKVHTKKFVGIAEEIFKAEAQIFGRVSADRIEDIEKRINEIQTKIKDINQYKSNLG